jgi:hypothetical protein
MSKNLNEIVAAADWKELTSRLLYYGDNLIRKCPWRGLSVNARPGSKLCVEGYGADDFLQEALDRFFSGRRSYDYSLSLEQNLRGAIRSMIWSVNKSSRRTPLIEIGQTPDDKSDPIAQLPSPSSAVDVEVAANERIEAQKEVLKAFEESIVGDNELSSLVNAYKNGRSKPRDIEKFTGIPAARISELKRKLRDRMQDFEARNMRCSDD